MKIPLSIIFIFVGFNLLAQAPFSTETKHYTRLDGLADNQTFDAVEDDRGLIWVMTANGISRFDGHEFKSFSSDNGFDLGKITNTFLDNDVLWLFEETIDKKYLHIKLFHILEEQIIPVEKHLGQKLPFKLEHIAHISSHANGLLFYEKIGQSQLIHLYTSTNGFQLIDFPIINETIIAITNKGELWLKSADNSVLRKVDFSGKLLLTLTADFFNSITSDKIIQLENNHLKEKDTIYFSYRTKDEVGVFVVDDNGKCRFKRSLPIAKWREKPSFLRLEWNKPEVARKTNFYYYPKLDVFLYRYLWYFGMITLDGELVGVDVYSTVQMFENQPFITNNLIYNFNSEGLFAFNFIPQNQIFPFYQLQGNGTTLENSFYDFMDENPINGTNYYRLKQMDLPATQQAGFDGNFDYSNIVNIQTIKHSNTQTLVLYPNPVRNELNIANGEGDVLIYNHLGQIVRQFSIVNTSFSIDVNDLPKGIYTLKLQKTDGSFETKQFVKL